MLGFDMFGFLNINKSPGPTSHDIVAAARRLLPRKTKVGHAGTLDPFASGVLVLGIGGATRLVEYVQDQPKRYVATVTLGATSTTDDSEGEITATSADGPNAAPPRLDVIEKILAKFTGSIEQIPPAHSAIHIDGQRAYKLARAGEVVDIPKRTVRIDAVKLLRYDYPQLEIDVTCGGGTYIRAMARDIGAQLGCGGYCSQLARTAIGMFTIDNAADIETIAPADIPPLLTAPQKVLDLPTLKIDSAAVAKIYNGQSLSPEILTTLTAPACSAVTPGGQLMLLDNTDTLVAVATFTPDSRAIHPTKVFRQ
ncbi:MAG: tRNA pseudouridine(55) synthase TruB [Phycisphaerae bacterium]|nr:tRNA pseudouridine(55) synthase TruB [Phycisphaerae bacterium]